MFACVIALIVYQLGLAFTGSIQIGGLIAAVILIAGLLYLLFRPYHEAARLTETVAAKV